MSELSESVQDKIDILVEDMEDNVDFARDFLGEVNRTKKGSWNLGDNFGDNYDFLRFYEKWYNSSKVLVEEYLPDRVEEFEDSYRIIRKIMEVDLDYLEDKDATTISIEFRNNMNFQKNILSSIPERVQTEQRRVRNSISEDVTSEEIHKSKLLLDDGHIRAAGVLAGVALERYLQTLCHQSEAGLKVHPDDTIASLAHELNDAKEISDDQLRHLEYLSGLRNKCAHADDESPNEREVERLIKQGEEFIRSS